MPPVTKSGKPTASAGQEPTRADIDRIDDRIVKVLDTIGSQVSEIEGVFRARPAPLGLPPAETPLTAPVPPAAVSFQSRVRGQLSASSQAAALEQEQMAARESPREQRLRREKLVEDNQVGRSVVTVPVSDIARGIANRGLGSKQAEPGAPLYTPEERRRLDERYKIVTLELERFRPFSEIELALRRLDTLSRTHFAVSGPPSGIERRGGAPVHLAPTALQILVWSWPPRPEVRRDLTAEFVAAAQRATQAQTTEVIAALKSRITQIERYPPIMDGPEPGGTIRA